MEKIDINEFTYEQKKQILNDIKEYFIRTDIECCVEAYIDSKTDENAKYDIDAIVNDVYDECIGNMHQDEILGQGMFSMDESDYIDDAIREYFGKETN